MKLAVRRSGLYQGRTRRSTGQLALAPARLHGELLHRGGGGDARRHRHRLRRGRRVRGVDDQQRVRRLVAPAILAEVAIDDEGDRRLRRIEGAAQLVHRRDAADQVEVLAGLHPRHELAALVRSRLVEHHHRQVLDVEVDRVAEDRHLHQRHHDDHPQRQVVARQLAELLDGERDQASHARPSLSWRRAAVLAHQRHERVLQRRLGGGHRAQRRQRRPHRLEPARRGDRAQRHAEQVGVLDALPGRDRRQRDERIALRHDLEHPAGERRLDLGRRAVGDQLAVEDQHQPRALLGLVHVVRGDEDGHAAGRGQLVDEIPELAAALRIDAAGGLVEEQQLGLVEERRGQRHALPLPGRERAGRARAAAART